MKMRNLFLALAVALSMAGPAAANELTDEVTTALVSQGYEIMQMNRTWLGRVRIVAESDEVRREIVINPYTGEVLRDYSVLLANTEEEPAERRNLFEDNDDSSSANARVAGAAVLPDASLSATEALGAAIIAPLPPAGE
ncbi:MAG: hypothetical protein NTX73_07770 [Rhodobacterales bacterium]|nr:hypothetical protein [Rhodobacterales bacterium]